MRNFQQMMDDCRSGKIDLILVKSASRLGRNTLQFLQACEELKSLEVEVYFQIEKLYLHNPKATRLLTIYASVYQNESETKSRNITWGIRTRFANGTSALSNRPCYGYRKADDGSLIIFPAEAEVVRQIYMYRRQGMSLRKIAAELDDADIPSPKGRIFWSIEAIRRILQNEKYYGSVILQKTYVSDYFTNKRSQNHGELSQYLLENHHEPIIE